MFTRHFAYWPKRVPRTLTVPRTPVHDNLAVSARRYPDKAAIYYYGRQISFRELHAEVEALAGYLQQAVGVKRGDRVALYMQNSPQFVVAYYAILRADAVVVPLNPMLVANELPFYFEDSGARVAVVGQELVDRVRPLVETGAIDKAIVACYRDALPPEPAHRVPDVVAAPAVPLDHPALVPWSQALASGLSARPSEVSADDLAVIPYTSGTTGVPKGCMHTHRTVQANIVCAVVWNGVTPDGVALATLPFFHVTGMEHSMNAPIYCGNTFAILTRWDRETAAELIEKLRVTHWTNIATMVVDFLANPRIESYDLSSLMVVGGGGAALPKAVGERLKALTGLDYVEGYGLSETIAQTHTNPPDRAKLQCAGIPLFDVDARIVDPETLAELGPGEEGEILVCGPQVFLGYWNRPEENEKAFVEIDGKRFFRTGDLGRYDEEGYFFIVDRIKRMINASGFKVWPTEVESILYKHPAVEQACVVGVPDPRRGETVKAFIILKQDQKGAVTAEDIIAWAHEQMAAYKCPREIEFVDSLPMSGSGKILWRVLQEEERKKRQVASP